MSAMHARAARRERQTAQALGSTRVHRRRGESAPDVRLVTLPDGTTLQTEVKSRKRLPHVLTRALEQAQRYAPSAVPCAVIFQHGKAGGLAAVRLGDFARLVGLDVAALPSATPLRSRAQTRQLTFPGM